MNFSARTGLMALATALLCVGELSLVLAKEPCDQFAEYDSCSDEGCDLRIITTCGPGSNPQQCEQWHVSANQVAHFRCVTIAGAGTRCLPALDQDGNSLTKPCMRFTACVYSNIQNRCVPDPVEWWDCRAPYRRTVTCPQEEKTP